MDRRRTGADTEQRILDATVALLDGGAPLAGLSVNRIVDRAGVSRATFYLHFTDKRALVSRLAVTELQEFERTAAEFLADPRAGRDELANAIGELVGLWRDHAGVLSSLIELAEYDADSREDWQGVIRAIGVAIAGAIRERNPQLEEPMVSTIAEVLAWTGERAMHQMVGDASDAEAQRVADALIEVAWRVIRPATSLPASR